MTDFVKLARELDIQIGNVQFYREAMTHKSFAAEHQVSFDNQRLELLGDAVVQIILTRYLYDRYPSLQEGDLTKIRSALANQAALALFARKIHLGEYLMVGKGEYELHGQERESTISDAFEAVIGAVYLDLGLTAAQEIFLRILPEFFPDPITTLEVLNPKGALQEFTQGAMLGVPQYRVVNVTGPDHDPQYEVEVSIQGKPVAHAKANSRKLAEREAAKAALPLIKSAQPQESPQ